MKESKLVPVSSSDAVVSPSQGASGAPDDTFTMCAVSAVAGILTNVLHEGVGHGLTALASGARSGVLTSVAWSSPVESRLVEAGGTLANLAAAVAVWLILRGWRSAAVTTRYFLLLTCAFNLFTGTGYFLFSGLTNFGDWAAVISGLNPPWLWRTLLVVTGTATYYGAVRVVGVALVRYVGVPADQQRRLRILTMVPYFSTILLALVAGMLNPIGPQLLWQSALPATAGAHSGLLWLQYYIPRATVPSRSPDNLRRNYGWIITAAVLAIVYVLVLGRGVRIHHW